MVSATPAATQSLPVQPQPTFTSGAEARARTEQVQPREAPAADAQRADRKTLQSRDDDRRKVEAKERDARAESKAEDNRASDGRRGSLVDISI